MRKKLFILSIICCLPLILLVAPSPSIIYQKSFQQGEDAIDNSDSKIILNAPNECEIGQLVELDASESSAVSYTWRVIPETPNFRVIESGKRALFCSGTPGKYLFVLAAAKRDTVDCVVCEVTVKGGVAPPVLDPFISKIKQWLPSNYDPNTLEKLAKSFERVASAGHSDVEVLVKTTALSNRGILGAQLESYKSFLENFSEWLKTNYAGKGVEEHIELWYKVAAALRALE